MNKQSLKADQEIWQNLVESHIKFSASLKSFFSNGVDRVLLMKEGFRRGDIATALYVAPHLTTEELQQLFKELVKVSIAPGYAAAARKTILSLPKEWVISNIEKAAEAFLQQDATENEYRRILELYVQLDTRLAYDLATKASTHSNEDIKEADEDFLEILSSI